ncbi:stage II sporulation protein M [Vagococcus sp.]|uniref:stage II sporulation protein M n=1 Tax=Vagococcus sp. TaxID=1933889 RepID=UPI003F9A43BF
MTIDWKLFKKFTLLFIGISVTSFLLAYFLKPNVNDFLNLADSNNKLGIVSNRTEKLIQYIVNNGFKVPFQIFLLSLIPIPLLYFLPVLLTAVVTGIVFYIPFMPELEGKLSLVNIVLGIIPHMFIEVFGFLIVTCGVYYVNKSIRSKLFKKSSSNLTFIESLKQLFFMYCCLALPALVMAAFIEAFITPLIS